MASIRTFKLRKFLPALLFGLTVGQFSSQAMASYTQSAYGNAVVPDASAVYFNPASMSLVKNPQFLGADTTATYLLIFNGTSRKLAPVYTQTGKAYSHTHYNIPSYFYTMPINDRFNVGIAGLYTNYGITDFPYYSLLRYVQTFSMISTFDVTPAVSVKINDKLAFGIGADAYFSNVELMNMSGTPPFIPDAKFNIGANGHSFGGHAGILFTPRLGTLFGLSYFSPSSSQFKGHSYLAANPGISRDVTAHFVQPGNILATLTQFFSARFLTSLTVQWYQWSVLRNAVIKNAGVRIGNTPVTLPSLVIPLYLKNTFRFTLGGSYKTTEKLSLRGALTYDQDPTDPTVGLATGDNRVAAVGIAYKVVPNISLDLGYAHVWYKQTNVNAIVNGVQLTGYTYGGRDFVGARLIVDFV